MKNLHELKYKKVAVLGLGIEGVALTKFLLEYSNDITLLDKETESNLLDGDQSDNLKVLINNPKVKTIFGSEYLTDLNKYDLIFRSPGISLNTPELLEAKKKNVVISSQIKLFFDLCPCKIIGVTGTKGKGTTSSLIYEIIKNEINKYNKKDYNIYLAGNIGYPAIPLIPLLDKNDLVVLELSSFQLMDLDKSPHVSVITNLSVDHLDYHQTAEEYRESKYNILSHQKTEDFAIINQKAADQFGLSQKTKATTLLFSKSKKTNAYIEDYDGVNRVILDQYGEICRQDNVKLLGVHNLENIAAAALVGKILNTDLDLMVETIKSFKGLPHRLEKVATIKNVEYINDSFATNPEPTMAAIDAINKNIILILGGSSKGADFTELVKKIISSKVKAIILIGEESEKIDTRLKAGGYSGQVIFGCKNMDEVVFKSYKLAKSGEVVLLSPACASFGMFKNYKDRGEKFGIAVHKLIENR